MDSIQSQENRSAQLNSLKIDRSAPTEHTNNSWLSWRPLLVGLFVGLAGAGGAILIFGGKAKPPPAPITKSVSEASTKAEPISQGSLVASGYVVARRRATVAAEITGRVTQVLVEEGMHVQKGQLLATLDPSLAGTDLKTQQSEVQSASAAINSIEADLADAERILARTKALASNGYSSTADLTRTNARVTSLKAQLAQAQAGRRTASSNAVRAQEVLGKHRILAPFSGVVVDKNAQPGEIISPASAGGGFTRTGICTIVDMDSLEIEVDVNEAFIGRVHDGQDVKAVLDAYPDLTIPARVIATVPTANRDKATVRVRIAILDKDKRILPDMAIKVSFAEAKS